MENNIILEDNDKQNRYYSHKKEDKYFFGSYFNLATNNILEVFEEVNDRYAFGTFTKRDIGSLKNLIQIIFKDELSIVDFEKRISFFSDYFPIMSSLDRKSVKEINQIKELTIRDRITSFRESLIVLVSTVDKLRNFYTHYHHETINIDKKVLEFLNNSLVTTALYVKSKYVKTDKTKEFLKETLADELDKLIQAYKTKQKEKNNKRFNPNNTDAIVNAIYNEAFRDFIYDEGKQISIANHSNAYFEYNTFKSTHPDFELNISEKGIVYLLSLFLTVKEIDSLKANLTGFKGKVDRESENSIKYMATQRIYSFHAYKGLKQRIKTSDEGVKETLLMQMIDELSKVPHVVYQHLFVEQQNSFIEDWNQYYKDYEDNVTVANEALVIHPVIRKRYEDKFNYFALRFLDEFFDFPTLRFQVHLGDYVHDRRNKSIANVQSDRVIKEKVTVFARLRDVNKAKATFFNKLKNEEEVEELGWRIFPNPSYDFPQEHNKQHEEKQSNAGKIGIYVKLKDNQYREKKILEDAYKALNFKQRSSNKKGKEDIINQLIALNTDTQNKNPIVYTGQPIAYLSMHDIHSILFALLTDNLYLKLTAEEVENKIVDQIIKQVNEIVNKDPEAKIIKRYNGIEKEGIDTNKLLKDLVLEGQTLEHLIEEQVKREKDVIYTIENKTKRDIDKNRKRKHLLFSSEKGKIGVWLSNDIKRFMTKETKEEWKGYQHSELQKLFAYYESSKEDLLMILSKVQMVKDFPMELVALVKKSKGLADFYTTYLKQRRFYIENIIDRVTNSIDTPQFKKVKKEVFSFLKEANYKVTTLDNQIQRILSMPLFIERGFMDSKPTMIPGVSFKQNKEAFANWFVYYKEHNQYQRFYDKKFYSIEIEEKNKKAKVDKLIKQQQKNDVFTLMMVNYMLRNVFSSPIDVILQLEELYQNREERLANKQIAKETQVHNINFVWNKVVDLKLCDGKIVIDKVKLKDIGTYRKYERDNRVNIFLTYQSDLLWKAYLPNDGDVDKICVIERQLDNYEKVRSKELLKEVQEIERIVYEKVKSKDSLRQGGNENFKQYVLQGLLPKGTDYRDLEVLSGDIRFTEEEIRQLEQTDVVERDLYSLIYIRNKFAHNQLPMKAYFDFCQKYYGGIEEDEYYAGYYLRVFKDIKSKYVG
jgi:hypothetical protein